MSKYIHHSRSECDCSTHQIPLKAFSILFLLCSAGLLLLLVFSVSQHFAIQNKQVVVINLQVNVEKPNCLQSDLFIFFWFMPEEVVKLPVFFFNQLLSILIFHGNSNVYFRVF